METNRVNDNLRIHSIRYATTTIDKGIISIICLLYFIEKSVVHVNGSSLMRGGMKGSGVGGREMLLLSEFEYLRWR